MLTDSLRRFVIGKDTCISDKHFKGFFWLQSNKAIVILALLAVFACVVIYCAIHQFRSRVQPFLIYLVGFITIYVAFCIKKTVGSGTELNESEDFYSSRHQNESSLVASFKKALRDDYIGNKVLSLIGGGDRKNDLECQKENIGVHYASENRQVFGGEEDPKRQIL